MTKDQRRAAVLQGFAELFGPQALNPVDFVEYDWTKERWTRGGPTAIHGPGTLVPYGPSVRRPLGRVHWAGTETATYWTRLHGRCGELGEARGRRGAGQAALSTVPACLRCPGSSTRG